MYANSSCLGKKWTRDAISEYLRTPGGCTTLSKSSIDVFGQMRRMILRTSSLALSIEPFPAKTVIWEWFYLNREALSNNQCMIVRSKQKKTRDLVSNSAC